MNALERIQAIVLRALALAGALVALTLIINLAWPDEELHPDLAQFVTPQPVSMDGNAYPSVWGFWAANDQDPHTTGVEIIGTLQERYLAGERVNSREALNSVGNRYSENWMQVYPISNSSCNWRTEVDCAERLIANIAQAEVNDERLIVLLNRLEMMLTLDRFEEIRETAADSPIPWFQGVITVSRIRLALAFDEQRTDLVLDRIGTDIRFWKMLLRDGDTLLFKMIALTGLRHDVQFLSALMHARNLSPTELVRVAEVLTPLSDEERDIGEAFLGEVRYVMRSFLSMSDGLTGPWSLVALIIKDNATMNDYYTIGTIPMRQRAALSASEYYEQLGEEYERYKVPLFPPSLYNLGGKYLLTGMMPIMDAMTDYISRVHDIDGQIALVLLQAEILANPDVPIERIVERSQYRNPYTLEPMDYDVASGMLSFECIGTIGKICAVQTGRN